MSSDSNKPLPTFTLPQPEPPKLTLWVACAKPIEDVCAWGLSYEWAAKDIRPATLDDLLAVVRALPAHNQEELAKKWRLEREVELQRQSFARSCVGTDVRDEPRWRARAEKAEARVAELEAKLKELDRLGRELLNAAADGQWDLLP